MKYGMRERISGALVLIALAVIFVPLLLDDPVPREDRPEPVLTIEQPVDVEQRDVAEPTPPDSVESAQKTSPDTDDATAVSRETVASEDVAASEPAEQEASSATMPAEETEPASAADTATESSSDSAQQADDPIAELARAADERQANATPDGEWAVQVGSFGQVSNAEGLQTRLEEQGYPAYQRARDNNLTTVYVGPYASSETAENVMGKLKAALNLQGLLVRTE
ncbi:SPOR domain-containing protein [Halomonas sp. 18H]|uniref:SPOR domain-containing protein n=1 Tax=Halomonas almeriensis TaxID=308163 RepID=UPI002231BD8C|nr:MULTISPECIES: SPOR domain-containing protein [Halomonas]MCW4151127.1 SPOR domain-containing protein [Halomonas sp. 18H]MDN3553007.1 SPOR domain-containing protein [Halomonas almeriensis]